MSRILGINDTGFGILVEYDGYVDKTVTGNDKHKWLNESFEIQPNMPILINCILQKWGVENKNGRIYPENVLVPEVERYMELVKINSAISEADHPQNSVVSLLNVSHRITKMWWGQGSDRNILYGTLEIITSPAYMREGYVSMVGDKIAEYLKRGIRLGISSRGLGSLEPMEDEETGKIEKIVQPDFELVCFDLVASPSTPGAYLFPEISKSFSEQTIKKGAVINEGKNHEKVMSSIKKFLI